MLPITRILNDPMQTGYFLAFCRIQHALENILFIMECDRYKDILYADKAKWPDKYQDLDEKIFISAKSSDYLPDMDEATKRRVEHPEWPSKVVHRRFVDRRLKEIWDTYISESAPTEICISDTVRRRTKTRANLVHIYGPTVFNEALYDPYITLRNDVMPRFLVSELCGEMNARIAFCLQLPEAASLETSSPLLTESPFTGATPDALPDTRQLELNEIIADGFLYDTFLQYLREHFCPENLLCIRKIVEFEEMYRAWNVRRGILALGDEVSARRAGGGGSESGSLRVARKSSFRASTLEVQKCPVDVENCAWDVYRFFVAPGSAYEINLSVRQRKDIMIALARPEQRMFDVLKATAMGFLATNFSSYKFTDEYTGLARMLRSNLRTRQQRRGVAAGCFG
jgi:hypothetical protein